MKESGMLRKVDPLGRIVIPAEIRRVMGINEGDPLEIIKNSNEIILKKYSEGCIFCGGDKNVINFKRMVVCCECKRALENC